MNKLRLNGPPKVRKFKKITKIKKIIEINELEIKALKNE